MTTPTLGMSDFARDRHRPGGGNSYCVLEEPALLALVWAHWATATPGHGEADLSRKIVISVPSDSFRTSFVPLQLGLPLQAEVVQRQEGEDLYVESFLPAYKAQQLGLSGEVPTCVDIVCYSAEALLENNGVRSTDCDWEIVAILAKFSGEEPMRPLTMARNFLELPGGTKSEYTAREFAEAIMYWSQSKGVKVKDVCPTAQNKRDRVRILLDDVDSIMRLLR